MVNKAIRLAWTNEYAEAKIVSNSKCGENEPLTLSQQGGSQIEKCKFISEFQILQIPSHHAQDLVQITFGYEPSCSRV